MEVRKVTLALITLLALVLASWQSVRAISRPVEGEPETKSLRPLVDPRPRRAQVRLLTGGAPPPPAQIGILATPPQTATWTVYDHMLFSDYTANFSRRYTSTHAYYYVDETYNVSDGALQSLAATFEANYVTIIANFGSPPDVDGQPRIFILLTDIRDEYTYDPAATTYVPCFFDPLHEHPAQPGSNGREMLYLDLNPTTPDSGEAGRCLTHQLALMVGYNYDTTEELWWDEGMATLAEFVAGYGHRSEVEQYLQSPNQPLAGWSGSPVDIGKTYLWALYLRERFGQAGVKQLFQSSLHGLEAIQPISGIPKEVLFHQWLAANYLDDRVQAGGIYGYKELDIVPAGADQVTSFTRPPLHETVSLAAGEEKVMTGTLAGYYAARYLSIQRASGSNLSIADVSPDFGQSTLINGAASYINWSAVMTDTAFTPGDSAILIVGRSRNSGSMDYTYRMSHIPAPPPLYFPIIFRN